MGVESTKEVESCGRDIIGDTGSGGNVVIPGTIDGKPVTQIGNSAFAYCTSLTKVLIPDSVTPIGEDAFDFEGLTGVYFQGNAPTAPDHVFAGKPGTVYYQEGTSGWGDTFGGWPTALYEPADRQPSFHSSSLP